MSLSIGVLNTKGGVGKTTTAMYLATAYCALGKTAEVWDSDPQGSATDWAYGAEDNGQLLPFKVSSVNKRELERKNAGADVILIDTPPGDSQILDAVTSRVDVLIVPTKPAVMDMNRVWASLDAIPEDLPAIVLLTHTNTRTVSYKQALDALSEGEVAVFDTPIKNLESIKNGANTLPDKLDDYELVAQELLDLMGEGK